MNIEQAKQQIMYAVQSYFTKDDMGNYCIPTERQRPIILIGPPGIGKTAIMEQIAQELGVGLVTYSMTHHTRQSALGLPFIVKKSYGGCEYSVSEYTMSEIIASVYDRIENDGVKEGILFLDEINCVSETLAPSMLQFLQYKVFGRHKVPDGWIVVTAGNPPEYNNSVREFDIVTWDRLKRIDVTPEFDVWKTFAYQAGVHPAVLSYLEIKKGDFYNISTTVDGKTFVTARGWVDLSDMIKLYEKNKFTVDISLVAQYIQNPKIAKAFAVYYDLFNKYRSDYQVDTILAGNASDEIINRARSAKFDERLSLLALILDAIGQRIRDVMLMGDTISVLIKSIQAISLSVKTGKLSAPDILATESTKLCEAAEVGKRSGALSPDVIRSYVKAAQILDGIAKTVAENQPNNGTAAFALIKKCFDKEKTAYMKGIADAKKCLDNIFVFCDTAFDSGNEVLILVTELTANKQCARFISSNGSDEYFKHNKELLFYERQNEIIREIEAFDEE